MKPPHPKSNEFPGTLRWSRKRDLDDSGTLHSTRSWATAAFSNNSALRERRGTVQLTAVVRPTQPREANLLVVQLLSQGPLKTIVPNPWILT